MAAPPHAARWCLGDESHEDISSQLHLGKMIAMLYLPNEIWIVVNICDVQTLIAW